MRARKSESVCLSLTFSLSLTTLSIFSPFSTFIIVSNAPNSTDNFSNLSFSLFLSPLLLTFQQPGYDEMGQPVMSETSLVDQSGVTNGMLSQPEEGYTVRLVELPRGVMDPMESPNKHAMVAWWLA